LGAVRTGIRSKPTVRPNAGAGYSDYVPNKSPTTIAAKLSGGTVAASTIEGPLAAHPRTASAMVGMQGVRTIAIRENLGLVRCASSEMSARLGGALGS
jgi:hypothetical protein